MIIHVKVHPGSKEEKIEKIKEGEYEVYINERAEKGKANKALVKLLSREFGVSFNDIYIRNMRSRDKIVEIDL